ncbi:S-layer homology domain-containing protein [Halobacillus karajensis]|uniref:Endo-beta-N-acetylglucosaminidase n=1 Tax=Halobacillus karajensis TaxID=195088 RepID=A0A059NWW2_9BACI|nr:S-layer homology domain-containing protein [Halobacillus karajensis]CDQ18923.1 Putative endo-beta-N-acetylglucosaminidase precursor [Halobacillus karajensis]CDQ23004.1 Putative endo-beta-N-acetylglucosaminidase precursor [Halobacillus karajensis]CDQ26486.1 Putative endo-beta-N-acetylglucosaminidase precursor [Halobacillus karajensis]
MKKLLLMGLSIVFLTGLVSPMSIAAEDDITGTLFEEDMRALIDAGIMEGYGDGTYGPKDKVTRAQFTTFIVRALDIEYGEEEIGEVGSSEDYHYGDVNPDKWYYPYILAATEEGLIQGYPNGNFGPTDYITRQDMAMIMISAAKMKGVVSEAEEINFEDNDKIMDYAFEAVQRLKNLGIINGKEEDGKLYYAPYDHTSRGETAAVINRLLKVLEPPKELDYRVATLTPDEDPQIHRSFETYDEAVAYAQGNQVVLNGNNIVWINDGQATTNAFTILYTSEALTTDTTYVTSGVDVEVIDIDQDWVKIRLADTEGYVDPDKVNLTPDHMVKDRSYYEVKDGWLYHRLYNAINERTSRYLYGEAPDFMKEDGTYYSHNGNTFYKEDGTLAGEAYQYFNRMPLYTETSYTGEQLDDYIAHASPDSPLIGTGEAFKKAEEQFGTNALYLLAHAIHESNWGKSDIARDKNNLFGIGANDGNPYEDAWEYESYEEGILEAAEDFIIPRYFDSESYLNYGAHLGNKSTGMNVKYASDAYWGQKIAGHMFRADQYLSQKYGQPSESGAYELAQTITPNVNVRSSAAVGDNKLYQIPKSGVTLQILDEMEARGT